MNHSVNDTLVGVGEGLGSLFDSLTNPLGNFLIVVGVAGGVVALFLGFANVMRPHRRYSGSSAISDVFDWIGEKLEDTINDFDWYTDGVVLLVFTLFILALLT